MDKDKALDYEEFIKFKEKRRKSIERDKDFSKRPKKHKISSKRRNTTKNIKYDLDIYDAYDDEDYRY